MEITKLKVEQERYAVSTLSDTGSISADHTNLQVRRTQRAIKHALTERFYAWEDARQVAVDEGLDLSGEGPVWTPPPYEVSLGCDFYSSSCENVNFSFQEEDHLEAEEEDVNQGATEEGTGKELPLGEGSTRERAQPVAV
jgi:hypothetical protein